MVAILTALGTLGTAARCDKNLYRLVPGEGHISFVTVCPARAPTVADLHLGKMLKSNYNHDGLGDENQTNLV